jgi:hypothetical protein
VIALRTRLDGRNVVVVGLDAANLSFMLRTHGRIMVDVARLSDRPLPDDLVVVLMARATEAAVAAELERALPGTPIPHLPSRTVRRP